MLINVGSNVWKSVEFIHNNKMEHVAMENMEGLLTMAV